MPLSTIARRVADMRNRRASSFTVREIMYEGYVDPMPVEDMPDGCRAVVLVDVSVTGRLLSRLTQSVERFGGQVIGRGVIVTAVHPLATQEPDVRSLCKLKMALSRTGDTPALRWRERRYFNPLSNCMTRKRETGRSPTSFTMPMKRCESSGT